MSDASLFSSQEYRQALRELCEDLKAREGGFTFQALAEAARIQKSYLSRVLRGDAHLSGDQLYRICEYLHLDADARSFLLGLAEWGRSEVPARRKELAQQIDRLRSKKLATAQHIQNRPVAPTAVEGEFFEDPWLAIIYHALSIPKYAKDVSRLAEDLKLSTVKIESVLQKLERLGAIRRRGVQWAPIENRLHLPPDHRLYPLWRNELRLLSTVRMSTHPSDSNYGFAAVCVGDAEARLVIRARFVKFLEEIEPWIAKAKDKEVFQIGFDLFSWTAPGDAIP